MALDGRCLSRLDGSLHDHRAYAAPFADACTAVVAPLAALYCVDVCAAPPPERTSTALIVLCCVVAAFILVDALYCVKRNQTIPPLKERFVLCRTCVRMVFIVVSVGDYAGLLSRPLSQPHCVGLTFDSSMCVQCSLTLSLLVVSVTEPVCIRMVHTGREDSPARRERCRIKPAGLYHGAQWYAFRVCLIGSVVMCVLLCMFVCVCLCVCVLQAPVRHRCCGWRAAV